MTIENTYSPYISSGDGTTTIFSSNTWGVLSKLHLIVNLVDKNTGAVFPQVEGTHYTMLNFDLTLWEIQFNSAPSSIYNVVVTRNIPITQSLAYQTTKGYQGENIEQSFDKLTQIAQDLRSDYSYAVKISTSATYPAPLLPSPQTNWVIGWDNSNKLVNIELGDPADYINVNSFRLILENTTLNVGGVGADFPSITDCLNAISTWIIAGNAILTIQLAEGIFQENITLDHPYGSKIYLRGQAPQVYTFVSLVGITSNGASDHDVEIEFTSVDNIAVNDYFTIRGATGTGEFKTLEGCLKVIAVDTINKTATFKNTDKRATIGACTLTAGAFRRLKTLISPTTGIAILVRNLWGWGSGNATGLKDLGLIGNGTASNGLYLEYGATLASAVAEIGINGFTSRGIYAIYAGTINAQFVCVSNCGSNGVYGINNSVIQIVSGAITGNGNVGIVSQTGTNIACSNVNSSGNNSNMLCGDSSNITCNNAFLTGGTGSYSMLCENNASINALGTTCIVDGELSYSLRARNGGNIDFQNGTITGSPSVSQIFPETGGRIFGDGATYATSVVPINFMGAGWGYLYDTALGNANTQQGILNLTIGADGSNIKRVLRLSSAHNFGSIPAHSQASQTFTMTGLVKAGSNSTFVDDNGDYVNGIIFSTKVSDDDEITLTASNITTGAISVGNRTYTMTAITY
jgi:hypothetical protein